MILIWLIIALTNVISLSSCYDMSVLDNIIDHPRLILTKERVEEIISMNATDGLFRELLANVKIEADMHILTELDKSILIDLKKITSVAAMYQITNDTKYSDWVIGDLLYFSSLDSWYNTQFLDVATMTFATTLSYDWVYEVMTDEQRQKVEAAIMRNSVEAALGITQYDNWSFHTNNWAQVCQGSMLLAAMIFADKNRTMTEELLKFSIPRISTSMEAYAPDGGWYEGYNYGIYGSTYMILGLAGLQSAIGNDWGLTDMEGIDKLGAWKTQLFAYDTLHFGWADGSAPILGPVNLWDVGFLEKRFEGKGWLANMINRFPVANLTDFRGLLWYDSESVHKYKDYELPLFARDTSTQTVSFRTSWEGDDSWFVGTRAGFNGLSHGYLDSGSFYILKNGIAWATWLESDPYGLPDYFHSPTRWKYYQTSSQAANTLCIANSTQKDLEYNNQVINANNSMLSSGETRWGGFSVANLTEAYNETTSVLRGVALFDNQVVIRDEVKTNHPVDVLSNWHTSAKVTIVSDKFARLVSNNETMVVEIQEPSNGRFHLAPTNPCKYLSNCEQNTNEGIYNLVVRLPDLVNSTTIQLVVHEEGVEPLKMDTSLMDWHSEMCTHNCYENTGGIHAYWLRHAENYYNEYWRQ